MTNEDYQLLLPTLPKDPGIYQFLDVQGDILYVGKAKNLKNRVSSYFTGGDNRAPKVRALVKNAIKVVFTIVQTEQDALLLESMLIKKHQPRYNVQLKDGKTYPYICIKNEPFPRVFVTRKVERDGSAYFGPYTSKTRVEIIIDLVHKLFQLRTCALNLSSEHLERNKYKVCLEYHIKNCTGPCAKLESEATYIEKINQIKNILKGNFGAVKAHLRREMQAFAEALDFENAQIVKDKLSAMEDYQGKSTVVNPNIQDVDVFSFAENEKMAFVNYMKVVTGAIINTYTLEMVKNLDDDDPARLLSLAIYNLREKFNSIAPELIVPFDLVYAADVTVTVPRIGDKKKLLELSDKNVLYYKLQYEKQELAKEGQQTTADRILLTMKKDLRMPDLPKHIECFDNSNFHGSYPVSSMVVFKNAKPAKRDYRHYNVKTVEGPNDFATMEEVVYRRYKRLLQEGKPLPQLIVIDGGKGQLSSAVESLKRLGVFDQVTVIGIAKKLEELYYPNDSIPMYLDKRSETLKVIQQIRDEAHRFAISFHRDQRSRGFTITELTQIKGIGEKTAEKLLAHYGSVKKVSVASLEELANFVGAKAGQSIRDHFGQQGADDTED